MFEIRPEDVVVDRINFYNTAEIPGNYEIYIKKFYSLPSTIVLPVDMRENTMFPDIFLEPFPMVSHMFMEVIRIYEAEPYYRRVILRVQNSKEYKNYFLLYIDEKSIRLFRDFELKRTAQGNVLCTVSLDFAESLLRRKAQGIQLREI